MGAIGAVGGGVRSEGWCQILANVLGRPIQRAADPQLAVARGAALLAAHHGGLLDRSDLEGAGTTDRAFEPDPTLANFYIERQAVFEAAFEALAPIHHALRAIESPQADAVTG